MKVIRASAMGFCFGVRDALDLADTIRDPENVTIHGELVHNESVLADLADRGFALRSETARGPLPDTPKIMITAHGVSERERARLSASGKRLIDTTCPLVRRVHDAAQRLQREGFFVIVIGKPGHVEVEGIIGDLEHYAVVDRPEAVVRYEAERLGVICQSTTAPDNAETVLEAIRARNPEKEIEHVSTICRPTRERQAAVRELIPQVEAMVIVGGRNSNNTRQLVELARASGKPAFHVQSAAELDPDWFAGLEIVGLTAGTSTPAELIEEVCDRLESLRPAEQEHLRFGIADG